MSKNSNLHRAKRIKNDEFYTRLEDIEKELEHYKQHFAGKTVYCNCDDPDKSAFWRYFHVNFSSLKLNKLIATYYDRDNPVYRTEYYGGCDDDILSGIKTQLNGNGAFQSEECVNILKEADIIVSNPPFSCFLNYVQILIENSKQFLIVGNMNAVKYKKIFPLIMTDKMWFGVNGIHNFLQPDGSVKKFGNINWYTNLDISKRHEKINLYKHYNAKEYPKYESYDAIEVSKVSEIPCDYDGVMGVPISFVSRYSPDQFKIIGEFNHGSDSSYDLAKPILHGKELYPRIAIQRKM